MSWVTYLLQDHLINLGKPGQKKILWKLLRLSNSMLNPCWRPSRSRWLQNSHASCHWFPLQDFYHRWLTITSRWPPLLADHHPALLTGLGLDASLKRAMKPYGSWCRWWAAWWKAGIQKAKIDSNFWFAAGYVWYCKFSRSWVSSTPYQRGTSFFAFLYGSSGDCLKNILERAQSDKWPGGWMSPTATCHTLVWATKARNACVNACIISYHIMNVCVI